MVMMVMIMVVAMVIMVVIMVVLPRFPESHRFWRLAAATGVTHHSLLPGQSTMMDRTRSSFPCKTSGSSSPQDGQIGI